MHLCLKVIFTCEFAQNCSMSAVNVDVAESKITKDLINSVDTVLFDIDGVLVIQNQIVAGSAQFIEKLRSHGKKIEFITNNPFKSPEAVKKMLAPFQAELGEITTPNTAFLEYLKEIDFKKDIFIIGTNAAKKLLNDAGFNVIDYQSLQNTELEEDLNAVRELSRKTIDRCRNVGIVYLDCDLNFCYGAVQVAQVILNNNVNVQLVSGCSDDIASIGNNILFTGPKYCEDALERWTKKKAIGFGKPGKGLLDLTKIKLNAVDPQRVLMIGDSLSTDIAFGAAGGFKTCLVLSSPLTKKELDIAKKTKELIPDYVTESVGEMYEKIKDL